MSFSYPAAIADARRAWTPSPSGLIIMDDWAQFLAGASGNVTSQNGEDGLLAALFARIGVRNRWCFEVGAGDGIYLSNTWTLRLSGWTAVLIEGDGQQYAELLRHEGANMPPFIIRRRIGPDSLDRILTSVESPLNLDLGVIDIDGEDLDVWAGLYWHRPRVMLVEFNVGGDGPLGGVFRDGVPVQQMGFESVVKVGRAKGYRPLARAGCNLLLLDESICPVPALPI